MENNNGGQFNTANPLLEHSSHIGGFALSLAAVLYIFIGFIVATIISGAGIEKNSDAFIYLNYIAAPLAICPCIAITLKYKKMPFKQAFPVKCHPKYYFIGLLLIFGLLFSLSWIDTGITELFKLCGYEEKGPNDYLPDLSGGKVVGALLVIAVLPAVFEEALFRGVILNSCKDDMGTVRTVFIVGFAFALFHTSAEQTVYQFFCGCVFAFLAVRAGSILPTVVMHFLNNGLIIIFGACGLLDESGNLDLPVPVNITLTVLASLSFVAAAVWLFLDKKPLQKCQKGSVIAFFAYGSVAIILLSIMWIVSFF